MNRVAAFCCLATGVLAATTQVFAADKTKRPSPPASVTCHTSGGQNLLSIDYSSPSVNGRKIFGGLVPFDKVWRLGANEATALSVEAPVSLGNQTLPAGKYTVFAIPHAQSWTLIISKKTGEWGTNYPGAADDVLRTELTTAPLAPPVERFLIGAAPAARGCALTFDWADTRASLVVAKP